MTGVSPPLSCRPICSTARLSLVLTVFAFSGCVNQNKEVAKYRSVLDGANPVDVPVHYASGQPLTLEASMLLASRRNEQLASQGETYLQSLIQRDRAFSVFLPTVSLAPSLSWQNKPLSHGGVSAAGATGTGTSSSGGGPNKYTAVNVPLTAQMNVSAVRDLAAVRGAYAFVGQQRNSLLDLQQTVMLETAQSYYQIVLAERTVTVLSNSVQFQEARVADMQQRFKAGLAQPLDIAQTQATEAATRAQLTTARNNVLTNRAGLAFLTNADVEEAAIFDRLAVPDQFSSIDQQVQIALSNRPDVQAAAAAVNVQQQNVQAAIGEYFPSVTLNLDYYLHRETFPTNAEWTSLISANLPIFSAGTIEADVRAAWSQLRTALYQQWLLTRQVRRDVKVAMENLLASRQRIRDLHVEVDASQEALRQAVEKYRAGLGSNLDVLTAQDTLFSSQLDLVTEEINYKVAYITLIRTLGQLARPQGTTSMSSSATSQPTTEELTPLVPQFPVGPATAPASLPATREWKTEDRSQNTQ